MSETQDQKSTRSVAFSSSVKGDVWHEQKGRDAFQSWHFDALSDDGHEAVIIAFYDNYPFSSRYFQQKGRNNSGPLAENVRFPAISFTYSIDGRVVLRAINEFRADEFSADTVDVNCTIGNSSFRVDAAEYGSGYIVKIDILTMRKRRITAELEWLSVEAGLLDDAMGSAPALWNIAAPRSDVSGRISLVGRRGKTRKIVHFRGTGYHDHFRSDRSLDETVGSRCWGRAHFVDSTAIFDGHSDEGNPNAASKLFLIREGSMHERETKCEMQNYVRDRFGLKTPRRLSFVSDDNIRLRVKPLRVIQSGFFEVKMLSEITLMLRDGKPRKTIGLTEFVSPKRMKNRLFRWFTNLRVGRNGKSPMF